MQLKNWKQIRLFDATHAAFALIKSQSNGPLLCNLAIGQAHTMQQHEHCNLPKPAHPETLPNHPPMNQQSFTFESSCSLAFKIASWNGWCWFRTKGSFDLFCRSEVPLKVSFHLWPSCFFFFVSLSFFCLLHPPEKVTFKAFEKFLVGIWNFDISSWNGPFPPVP